MIFSFNFLKTITEGVKFRTSSARILPEGPVPCPAIWLTSIPCSVAIFLANGEMKIRSPLAVAAAATGAAATGAAEGAAV